MKLFPYRYKITKTPHDGYITWRKRFIFWKRVDDSNSIEQALEGIKELEFVKYVDGGLNDNK